jgi:protein-S-isoprenylcysteine O-methyltransferase Ste14
MGMSPWVRGVGFVGALAGILSAIILLPAVGLGIGARWQVTTAMLLYLVFFVLGTGRRVMRHGDLAERKQDRQVRSRGGRFAFLALVLGMLAAHWLALFTFAQQPGSSFTLWSGIGLGLALLGMGINQIAIRTLGRFFDRLAIKTDHELITQGIYGVIRHPIYTSYLCLFFSFTLLMESLWGSLLMAGVCAIWFGSRIPLEEAMLEENFGREYQEYKARTKRLIPFVY